MWDDAMPAECLRCWLAQHDMRYSHTLTTSGESFSEVGTYHLRRSIRRSSQPGRRLTTELMVNDMTVTRDAYGEVIRSIERDVACLKELGHIGTLDV